MKTRWISLILLLSLALGSCSPSQTVVEDSPTLTSDATDMVSLVTADVTAATIAGVATAVATFTVIETDEWKTYDNTLEASDMTISPPPEESKSVDLAKQDLADRLKIDPGEIALLKTMEITWPNISAGCSPSAGQILTKGRVYGYRVWLEAESEGYIYHVGLTGQVILCPKPIPGANNPLLMTPDSSNQDPQNQAP